MPMPVDEFTEFAAAVTPRLVRAAYLLTGDLGAAEDLVQEALVRTYRHGRRVLIDGALESYTRTTMYRLQLRSWRRRRFRLTDLAGLHAGVEPSHDPTEEATIRLLVQRALAQLPPRQRAVIVPRFFGDIDVNQTVEILQCGAGTVKGQTAKTLAKLRVRFPHCAWRRKEQPMTDRLRQHLRELTEDLATRDLGLAHSSAIDGVDAGTCSPPPR